MNEEPQESILGPIVITSIASALLGAILALVVLAWLNEGELEFVRLTQEAAGSESGEAVDVLGRPEDGSDAGAVTDRVIALEAEVEELSAAVSLITDEIQTLGGDMEMPMESPEADETDESSDARRTPGAEDETAEPEDEATQDDDRDTAEPGDEPTEEPTDEATPEPTDEPTRRPTPLATATLRIGR